MRFDWLSNIDLCECAAPGKKKEFSSINRQNQLKRSQSSDSSRSYNNKIYLRASNLVQLSGENRRINAVLSDQFMR